ncbi:hypothetical protein DFH09DRAFT_1115525 [Mycena vulgaris]|nr:hypothetical protein DFH09DRAFT_1115525 [Mycena vulgaris]
MPELPEALISGTLPEVFIHDQPAHSLVLKAISADATRGECSIRLGKDTGSGQPGGFSGRVRRVRVAGQLFSTPEPAGTRGKTEHHMDSDLIRNIKILAGNLLPRGFEAPVTLGTVLPMTLQDPGEPVLSDDGLEDDPEDPCEDYVPAVADQTASEIELEEKAYEDEFLDDLNNVDGDSEEESDAEETNDERKGAHTLYMDIMAKEMKRIARECGWSHSSAESAACVEEALPT